jgi:hypothetical protein
LVVFISDTARPNFCYKCYRFVSEHFTPLTLDIKTGVVSDEDTAEIWEAATEVAIEKVRRNKDRTSGGDSTVINVGEVEKSFWLSRPDGYPHYNGSVGSSGRSRIGGRGCSASRRTTVSKGKGMAGIFQGLWD